MAVFPQTVHYAACRVSRTLSLYCIGSSPGGTNHSTSRGRGGVQASAGNGAAAAQRKVRGAGEDAGGWAASSAATCSGSGLVAYACTTASPASRASADTRASTVPGAPLSESGALRLHATSTTSLRARPGPRSRRRHALMRGGRGCAGALARGRRAPSVRPRVQIRHRFDAVQPPRRHCADGLCDPRCGGEVRAPQRDVEVHHVLARPADRDSCPCGGELRPKVWLSAAAAIAEERGLLSELS